MPESSPIHKVACTIADLADASDIQVPFIAEAIQTRKLYLGVG